MTRPPRSLIVFLLAVTLVRLAAAAIIPLSEDEAYYRLWAEHLQLGYYDHPPMIAWWVRAGMAVAGDTPLGVRLLPVLSAGLALTLPNPDRVHARPPFRGAVGDARTGD